MKCLRKLQALQGENLSLSLELPLSNILGTKVRITGTRVQGGAQSIKYICETHTTLSGCLASGFTLTGFLPYATIRLIPSSASECKGERLYTYTTSSPSCGPV
jgi:hypothetical protein